MRARQRRQGSRRAPKIERGASGSCHRGERVQRRGRLTRALPCGGTQPRPARVDPIERRSLFGAVRRDSGAGSFEHQPVGLCPATLEASERLRLVLRPRFHRDLVVRAAEDGIVLADVEAHRRPIARLVGAEVELGGTPRAVAGRDAARIARRVGGRIECLAREHARHLVMAVPIARRAAEDRDDDVRTERAHDRHHVAQHRVLRPVRVRLLGALGEAEVVRAREILGARRRAAAPRAAPRCG